MIHNHTDISVALYQRGLPEPRFLIFKEQTSQWICVWKWQGKDLRSFWSVPQKTFTLWLIEMTTLPGESGTHTSITEAYAVSLLT